MPYIRIQPQNFYLQVPIHPGVYRIFSLDNNDNPVPLQRVLNTDTSGILYIGKSENLRDRLRMLWRVLTPGYQANAHTFGLKYNSLPAIQAAFPLNTLAVDIQLVDNPEMLESNLLEAYRQVYGEVPPLNSSK